ncbi:MAG: hypothetical protein OXO49_04860 [Gammaproteobacteria bacterium]|nr:hypothetical protein [Gammaproteobacteria bacterium]MDE0402573.1 hypothetical protein [Gammaproteobacteria bacterium]
MDTLKVPGEVYLVGGFVRDQLLGNVRVDHERDWVVIGTTPTQMETAGFKRVDASFPVFLHPITNEQYALARTERKVGTGHKGFSTEYDTDVTLEQDLARRDLTINAIAKTVDGSLVDPFNGKLDLQERVLRHVTDAFVEDPLRVFRVARFTAQLPDFQIATETQELMRSMRDELASLSAERVWSETLKAMNGPAAYRYFRTIQEICIVEPWFEDIRLNEIADLQEQRQLQGESAVAAIGWIQGPERISRFLSKIKASRKHQQLVRATARSCMILKKSNNMNAEDYFYALKSIGAFRNEAIFLNLVGSLQLCSGLDLSELVDLVSKVRCIRVQPPESISYEECLHRKRIGMIQEFLDHQRN